MTNAWKMHVIFYSTGYVGSIVGGTEYGISQTMLSLDASDHNAMGPRPSAVQ